MYLTCRWDPDKVLSLWISVATSNGNEAVTLPSSHFLKWIFTTEYCLVSCPCYIMTLDWAINQRWTCVNKRKKKRRQVSVLKEYRQMLAAVELVETGRPEWGPACRLRAVVLSNPSQDAGEVLSGYWKITQRAMVKRRSWVNRAVSPCLSSSLTYHRNINPFENKVWEILIFIKKCVHWSL